MSTFCTEVERKSDGVVSGAIMVDDFYGSHRYAIAIPNKKCYPIDIESIDMVRFLSGIEVCKFDIYEREKNVWRKKFNHYDGSKN